MSTARYDRTDDSSANSAVTAVWRLFVLPLLRAVAARHGVDITLPWNFVTVEEFEASLAATGFEVLFVRLVPRPTSLPSGDSPLAMNVC